MLRRSAGNIYSQSNHAVAIAAVISGTSFNFCACPTKRYRRTASLRNIFRNFMATADMTNPVASRPAATQNPDTAACGVSRKTGCHHFASGLPQRCRKTLEQASMIHKYLSFMEIRPKNPVSCLGFAVDSAASA
jgi:hypothetical protein